MLSITDKSICAADPSLADVLAITNELFPGNVSVRLSYDPADSEVEMVVFGVDGTGDFDLIIDREVEWGMRVAALKTRSSGQYRLDVVPTP